MDNTQNNKAGKTIEKRLWIVACFIFAIFFLFFLGLAYLSVQDYYSGKLFGWRSLSLLNDKDDSQCDDCIHRKIDGVLVSPDKAEIYPVAVMIEIIPKHDLNLVFQTQI